LTGDNNSETDKLLKKIVLFVAFFTLLLIVFLLISGKETQAKGFFLGSVTGLTYLKFQALYTKNMVPKNRVMQINKAISSTRLLIVFAVLFITIKRPDLFDLLFVFSGLFSTHFLSVIIFAFEIFKSKKNTN